MEEKMMGVYRRQVMLYYTPVLSAPKQSSLENTLFLRSKQTSCSRQTQLDAILKIKVVSLYNDTTVK